MGRTVHSMHVIIILALSTTLSCNSCSHHHHNQSKTLVQSSSHHLSCSKYQCPHGCCRKLAPDPHAHSHFRTSCSTITSTAHQHGTGVILIDATTCQPSHCLGPEAVQAFFYRPREPSRASQWRVHWFDGQPVHMSYIVDFDSLGVHGTSVHGSVWRSTGTWRRTSSYLTPHEQRSDQTSLAAKRKPNTAST